MYRRKEGAVFCEGFALTPSPLPGVEGEHGGVFQSALLKQAGEKDDGFGFVVEQARIPAFAPSPAEGGRATACLIARLSFAHRRMIFPSNHLPTCSFEPTKVQVDGINSRVGENEIALVLIG